jgi:hypothetical protein
VPGWSLYCVDSLRFQDGLAVARYRLECLPLKVKGERWYEPVTPNDRQARRT